MRSSDVPNRHNHADRHNPITYATPKPNSQNKVPNSINYHNLSLSVVTSMHQAFAHTPGKPGLLCLHGRGTSALIFDIQLVRLQRVLSPLFNFILVDAPFESEPGPGVIPVFEECGPFYSWTPIREHWPDGVMNERSLEVITKELEKQEAAGVEVVGVLSFSQGTRMASGLLHAQEKQEREHELVGKIEGDVSLKTKFKFGVFLMGACPPLVPPTDKETKRISIPSLHVVGAQDQWRDNGQRLKEEYFDQSKASFMELQVGHHLPVEREETLMITEEILRLWNETRGSKN